MKILICEDEADVAGFVRDALLQTGYEVDSASTGGAALEMLMETSYDAAILDVMLPDLTGLEVLAQARQRQIRTPILLLTAMFRVEDRIAGLDAGADDYLVKPFALGELLARVRVLLRRPMEAMSPLRASGIELDPASRRVTFRDRVVFLSSTEFSLLNLLMRNEGRVVTRSQILSHVWDDDGYRGSNVVDVYVNYLRSKLDPRLIHTVRGVGYVLGKVDEE